uniref:Uncharacterized protein n=1 Tax=Desertifilum tharense IPPAS B-1220 TaxID=1781255 RepID=A0ACD5GRE4_9CYAN
MVEYPLAQLLADSLVPWKVAIASLFAYFLYILPWQNWGWSNRPWKLAATLVPLIGIVENPAQFYPISLLIAVIFYLFLAWDNQQIRYTYISTLLLLWISWRYFATLSLTHPIWYIVPLGCCILYIAQVDPRLNQPTYRPLRHFIRLLGRQPYLFHRPLHSTRRRNNTGNSQFTRDFCRVKFASPSFSFGWHPHVYPSYLLSISHSHF